MPSCSAAHACSNAALLSSPSVSTTTYGSSTPSGAAARSVSPSSSGSPASERGASSLGHVEAREHGAARLDGVGEAARRAQVVLQHQQLAGGVAHEVQAGQADPGPAGRAQAEHRGLVAVGGLDHPLGHDALGDRAARPVGVGDEGVERAHALDEAGLERRPLARAEHARHGSTRNSAAPPAERKFTPRSSSASRTPVASAGRSAPSSARPAPPASRGAPSGSSASS